MPKRTFQPKKVKTLRKLGFRARQSTPSGRRILKRRMNKNRQIITKSDEFRLKIKKPTHKVK